MTGRRSTRGWLLQAATFVVGLVVLGVCLGLGPRHAAKEGASPTAALGLAVLVVGLGVVLVTGWRLLRATRKRLWLVTIPVLVTTTYVGCWALGIGVAAAFPPRPDLGSRTPDDLGLAYRDVSFPAADGVRLRGWYLPSTSGRAVALLHGAVDHLLAQPDVAGRQVGVVGRSTGGEQAIGAAGADDRIGAVVAEGAPEPAPLREAVTAAGSRAPATRFLLVTAGDVPDERFAAVALAATAPGTVEVWTVAGAGHTGGLRAAPATWADRVSGFLEAALVDEEEAD